MCIRDSFGDLGVHQIFPGHGLRVAAQHDVGTTTSHVGGNGDGVGFAGLGHNGRFFFMVFGVEHLVLDALSFQKTAQLFGFFDGNGAHQHRLRCV